MLKLSKTQMTVFREQTTRSFEEKMIKHVSCFFPNHYKILGKAGLLAVVRFSMDRAASHGFTSQRATCIYLTVMLMLGSNFDVDLLIPWAAEILRAPTLDPEERAALLAERSLDYVDRLAGKDNFLLNRALLRLHKGLPQIIDTPYINGLGFEDSIIAHLGRLFPSKHNITSEPLLRQTLRYASQQAERYLLTTEQGHAIYALLALLLGSSFDSDPQLHGLTGALSASLKSTPQERANMLLGETLAYLESWLAHA